MIGTLSKRRRRKGIRRSTRESSRDSRPGSVAEATARARSAGVTRLKGDLQGLVRAPALGRDDAQHPPEPVLRLHLQCGRRADRGRGSLPGVQRLIIADHRRRGDVAVLRQRGRQRAEAAAGEALAGIPLWARSSRPGGESRDFGLIFPEVRNFARGVLPNERPALTRRRFEMLEKVAIVADFMADEGPVEAGRRDRAKAALNSKMRR